VGWGAGEWTAEDKRERKEKKVRGNGMAIEMRLTSRLFPFPQGHEMFVARSGRTGKVAWNFGASTVLCADPFGSMRFAQ